MKFFTDQWSEISIPGVSDKYKTNSYIDALIQKEKVPLNREQESLDRYKEQQSAWRDVNQKMSSLRENSKSLYSFENPFNNKIASSSDENAVSATANRDAAYESFKIDVIKEATTDKFLSAELEKNSKVPSGKYTFQVADKTVSFNWKGGKITDFITSLNKRGNNMIKASLVGVSGDKQSLMIESLKTGAESNLVFKDDALTYALDNKIVEKNTKNISFFGTDLGEFLDPQIEAVVPENDQEGMPAFTKKQVSIFEDTDDSMNNRTIVPPRSGIVVPISEELLAVPTERIDFSFSAQKVDDITEELNIKRTTRPELPDAGNVSFEQLTLFNDSSETTLPPVFPTPLTPISGEMDFFVQNADGSEVKLDKEKFTANQNDGFDVSISKKDFPELKNIIVRNRNTDLQIALSPFSAYDEAKMTDYVPVHAISEAGDAILKYEGITITRPTNKIDDVVPNVTLNVKQPTDKTATITINPDKESAKDALIKFVVTYNQVIAEMNILSDNKPEIIAELDYLSKEEQDEANKKLGMFQGDFTLTNGKSSMRNIVTASYKWSDDATLTMLNQIGISSRASGTSSGAYNASQMRGYLEIDEKKLDAALEENLDQIKNLFGYDADGDLIIDSGLAFSLDRQLTSWVQTGGIIANKNSAIATKITASENNIKKLEAQIDGKEAQLRNKYGQMEGTLNSLNSQSNSINNYFNAGKSQ